MRRQNQEFREMQHLSGAAGPYNMHMLARMEQLREWRQDAEASRAAMVARRRKDRERAGARQRAWARLQAAFRPARRAEPEPC